MDVDQGRPGRRQARGPHRPSIVNTALNVPSRDLLNRASKPNGRAHQEVPLRNGPSTGWSPAVTTSSRRWALAEGNINDSDRILIELLTPPDMPQVVMICWPQHSTVVAPTRFPSTASEIARLFARASTELTRIRARRL